MSLTIRNLTITPLELKQIERFDGDPVHAGRVANLTAAFSGLINGTSGSGHGSETAARVGMTPRGDAPSSAEELTGLALAPFTALSTSIKAPEPGREVLRLRFERPGAGHRYRLDIPGPSPRTLIMTAEGGDGAKTFSAVYLPHASFLALFSSANLAAWMRELRGSYPLSALSIPGTHNSPTHHVALPSVRCQAVDVRAQLENGVRFLDVRVSAGPDDDDDDLALVHGVFPVSLTGTKWFKDLLVDVYAFLDANPSEAVLMSVKREGTGKATDQQLSRYLARRYLAGDDARRWFTTPRIPTLDEARGKVVLVRRFGLDEALQREHGGAGWGIDGSSWPDNCEDGTCGSGLIRVQDFYEVEHPTHITKKIDFVHKQLERCAEQLFAMPGAQAESKPPEHPSSRPVFVNFLSASNFFNASLWPENIAAKLNPSIIDYLCTRHGDSGMGPNQLDVGHGATGVVVTDWVGRNGDWDLVRCIVGWNSMLQLKS
ncbi:hypothetical protein P8C59_007851 [Phyllachora maydis]|uniref:Phosphatidylinositol-specific phospholipase C X domain-containing protein n=1 Tax=Phyllachora maydis TaxID=1825666 RepID=A0AAD9MIX8_9PEZI|nr:hypothetical protein P8C59_007851 [Phyllachora maydis]